MAYTSLSWSMLRLRLHERTEQQPFWDHEEARLAVNEALCLWNLLTGTWRRAITLPTVAGQSDYVLPATMLYRTRFTVDGAPLSSSSLEEFNLGRPRWRSETTTSGGDVPTRPMLFAPISLQLVYIWPADAVGGLTLGVEGVSATPVLVEDGDTVDLSNHTMNILLGFALHVLSFKKGGPAFAATQPFLKDFLVAAAEKNSQIKTTTVYRRMMGLDRRDLKPLTGVPTDLDQIAGVTR